MIDYHEATDDKGPSNGKNDMYLVDPMLERTISTVGRLQGVLIDTVVAQFERVES